jgi:hypothetical protein
MTTHKTAPLDGSLIARKGEAVPAAVGTARQKPIAMTVKLDPALYLELKALGMRYEPRKTGQEMLVEAVEVYLRLAREADMSQGF